jgi:PhnB protein
MYVPEGYGTVFPYMIVDRVDVLSDFLKRVFGATEEGRTVLPNGRIANVRIRIGTSTFMVSEAGDGGMRAMPGAYYVYVDDVDGTFAEALAADAKKIFEPTDMPYLDRQAGVEDPCGNVWWISKRLVEEPYDT